MPLARAAAAHGHCVVVTGAPSLRTAVEASGLVFLPSGTDLGLGSQPLPLRPVDLAAEDAAVRDAFAGRLARLRADALREVLDEVDPDVVVGDELDLGALVAAERRGVPCVRVLVLAAGRLGRPDLVGPPLQALRAEHTLPDDPGLACLSEPLLLSPCPPAFRDPLWPLPPTARAVLPAVLDPRRDARPWSWPGRRPGRPLVHVTLGTVFVLESGDLLSRVLGAQRRVDVDVVAAVGRLLDPAALGPQPDHVRIERWIVPSRLLPQCSAVVSHAGSGTVVGALAHGLPQVCLPMGADQPANAERVEALGLGRRLDPLAVDAVQVADTVARLLDDPAPARAAADLAASCRALPGPDEALGMVTALV